MKDSRFGYSTLTREESRRFQTAAYTYGQFQTLFGIDCEANVQPWEYSSETVPKRSNHPPSLPGFPFDPTTMPTCHVQGLRIAMDRPSLRRGLDV